MNVVPMLRLQTCGGAGLDVSTPHHGGCEHARGFLSVHDELTNLNLSHIQRVFTGFHEGTEHASTEER